MMNVTDRLFLSAFFPAVLLLSWPARRFFGDRGLKAVLLAAGFVFVCLANGDSCCLPCLLILLACVFSVLAAGGKPLPLRLFGAGCCLLFLVFRILGVDTPAGFGFLIVEITLCAFGKESEKTDPPLRRGLDTALCLTFFPAYQSGPVRTPGLFRASSPVTADDLFKGLMRLCVGLGKKMLIAENIYPLTAAGSLPGSLLGNLTAFLFSALYVYYDFSGYTDMALGLAACLGFQLPENFDRPFRAGSIRDFWKRWHMTLSGFLRDFVYIPLGGSRRGDFRTCLNTLAVFLVTVLWHGLTVPFLCFGLWHALFVILEKRGILAAKSWPSSLRRLYTLFVILTGFVFFMAPDGAGLLRCLCPGCLSSPVFPAALSPLTLIAACASILLLCLEGRLARLPKGLKWFLCVLILVLSLMHRAGAGYLPFLYGTF